jgi:hypothetical protein
MTTELKPLGQRNPVAATLESLYTVPASTQALGSSIMVCNRSAASTKFRIAIRPLGAAISDEMYIYYDAPISGFNTFEVTTGITLQSTDVVSVYALDATLSFNLFGQEIT